MSSPNYVRPLFRSWRFLLTLTFLGAMLALLFSLASPLRYSSSVRLLVTQNNVGSLDPYTAIKATERIASSLSELVYSTSFFDQVMAKAPGVDATYFPQDEYSKRQLWRETIETSIAAGTGIMDVTVFHPDRSQARVMVEAASRELANQAQLYFGSGVRVQVIDSPLDSRWFVRPRFLMNAIFGAVFGLFLGVVWILMQATKRE
jgi:capsular polysaccharide biosynthesis protein